MLRDELREVVRGFDPGCLTSRDARTVAQTFAELERSAGAGKTLVARLEDPTATEEALRDGRLSRVQVNEVTAAAAVDPEAEQTLLHVAGSRTVKALRERGKQVRAAARAKEADRYRRIKKNRHVSSWEDDDDAHVHLQSTPDDLAVVLTGIGGLRAGHLRLPARPVSPTHTAPTGPTRWLRWLATRSTAPASRRRSACPEPRCASASTFPPSPAASTPASCARSPASARFRSRTYRGYTPVQCPDGQWDLIPPGHQAAEDRAPHAQVA